MMQGRISAQLGGALRFAALMYEPNLRLLRWLTGQMETLGVDVRLSSPATVETVRALQPNEVIVATGAARERSDLPGADHDHVLDGDDLRALLTGSGDTKQAAKKLSLTGRVAATAGRKLGLLEDPGRLATLTKQYMPLGTNVTIIGGGLVGIEMAEFLVERGRNVTVLEEGPTMATEMAHPRRWRVLTDLRDHGSVLITGARVIEITDAAVRYATDEGEAIIESDHVVLATGLIADETVADIFRSAGFTPTVIGDCTGVGYLEGAMRDGFHAGAAVG